MSGVSVTAGLVEDWERGAGPEKAAAELARRISAGRIRQWEDLPRVHWCGELGVSERELYLAKQLLAGHGVLEVQRGRYVVIAEAGFLGVTQAAAASGQSP